MNFILQMLKSRTVVFGLIVAVLGVLQAYVFLLPITPFMQMLVALALAVLIIFFRYITDTPLFKT